MKKSSNISVSSGNGTAEFTGTSAKKDLGEIVAGPMLRFLEVSLGSGGVQRLTLQLHKVLRDITDAFTPLKQD